MEDINTPEAALLFNERLLQAFNECVKDFEKASQKKELASEEKLQYKDKLE